ncbi:glycosyl hydrolase family 18 protein [Chloroflexota bacterium]
MSKQAQHITGQYSEDVPPPGERELPDQRFGRPGCVLLVGLAVGILAAALTTSVVLFFVLRPTQPDGGNAVWLGISWGEAPQTEEAVQQLAGMLKAQNIDTLYVWTTWLQEDKTWSETTFEHIGAFVGQVKAAYPEARVDAWIGLPTELPDYRLDDSELQTIVADFSGQAVQDFGFDGIHINAEPVWDGDENYLALLRAVRQKIGEDVVLSVAVPPDWNAGVPDIPVGEFTTPDAHWNQEYKQRVGFLADEIAVMAYNSGLTSPLDYQTWMAFQVTQYATALDALEIDTRLIMGIPTYDAELPGHDPAVESVQAAISGVQQGIEQSGQAGNRVRGLGIYAYWSTDASEWNAYSQLWLAQAGDTP